MSKTEDILTQDTETLSQQLHDDFYQFISELKENNIDPSVEPFPLDEAFAVGWSMGFNRCNENIRGQLKAIEEVENLTKSNGTTDNQRMD